MGNQNLVSATLSPESKAEILKSLAEVKKRLAFLTSLDVDEVRSLVKAGNGYAPLLDKAYAAVSQHPEIMPAVFSLKEFEKDYLLYRDLAPIASAVKELSDSLQDTMIALASDTMVETLDIYQSVKQHKGKVPGLNSLAEDMGVFFSRPKRKAHAET